MTPPTPSPPQTPSLPSSPHSETTQVHRRPRSPIRPTPCACTHVTTAKTAAPTTPTTPLPPSPHPSPAVTFAAHSARTLSRAGPSAACTNATALSTLLADVVAALDDHSRTFWCQMMDTLALRTAAGDVQYSVAIAPHLPWLAEQAYATHHRVLRVRHHVCRHCGGYRPPPPLSPVTNASCARDDKTLPFSWVDEDDSDDDIGNTQRLPVPSFEAYICDVLDEHGKNQFVRERYYGGPPLNTRYLLAKFGTSLGMTQEEVALRAADLIHDEEQIPFSDDDYMSGVSDVESQDRSDNGV